MDAWKSAVDWVEDVGEQAKGDFSDVGEQVKGWVSDVGDAWVSGWNLLGSIFA